MGEEHVKEASWVVHNVIGSAAYLAGVDYDIKKFKQENDAAVEYIKKSAQG